MSLWILFFKLIYVSCLESSFFSKMENYTDPVTMRLCSNSVEDVCCDTVPGCTDCGCSDPQHVQAHGLSCNISRLRFRVSFGSSLKVCSFSVIFFLSCLTVCVHVAQSAPQSNYQNDLDWYRERETMMVVSIKAWVPACTFVFD